MFSQKRMSNSPLNASRLGRSHSLRGPNDTTQSNLNSSVGLNKISHNLGLIYNDSILQSYKSPLPIKVNEIISKLKSQDSSHISMTILPNGHACFSYEKKLLIWKLKKSLKVPIISFFTKNNFFISKKSSFFVRLSNALN